MNVICVTRLYFISLFDQRNVQNKRGICEVFKSDSQV